MTKQSGSSWSKWRFTFGGLYLVAVFAFLAYKQFSRATVDVVFHVVAGVVFLGIAAVFGVLEWKSRKRVVFKVGDQEDHE